MKSFGHKLVLTMALLAALALATTAVADKSWKQVPNADEVVFDENFTRFVQQLKRDALVEGDQCALFSCICDSGAVLPRSVNGLV